MTKITDWSGAYDLGWKGLICDEAFSHPAKYSRALIFKIIEYALQGGLIQPGQTIVDPFGGVALGALPSLMNGLSWVGCELEERFCLLGRKNIDLWNGKFSSMPKWTGSAQLLQGDSRRLAEVIAGAGLVVSSPPYAVGVVHDGTGIDRSKSARKNGAAGDGAHSYGSTNGQLASLKEGDITAVISSPPFAGNTGGRGEASRNGIDAALFDRHSGGMKRGTGSDPANLDHLPMGQVSAVIASPPYADGLGHDTGHPRLDEKMDAHRAENGSGRRNGYGGNNGQLGAMVVGSPPFENSTSNGKLSKDTIADLQANGHKPGPAGFSADYGSTPGQIGTESGETFWTAARLIVTQCYQILPDNAAAIWVTKRYVKDGKIVDFSQQWASLCEACGFEVVEWIRASLVKNGGTEQVGIDGQVVSKSVKRSSFFRRLHEKKRPDLAIDWEDVIVTRKKGVNR